MVSSNAGETPAPVCLNGEETPWKRPPYVRVLLRNARKTPASFLDPEPPGSASVLMAAAHFSDTVLNDIKAAQKLRHQVQSIYIHLYMYIIIYIYIYIYICLYIYIYI